MRSTCLRALAGASAPLLLAHPAASYQNPFGNDQAPNPALFPFFPSGQYDTFVTIGALTSDGDGTKLAGSSRRTTAQGAPDPDGRALIGRPSMDVSGGLGAHGIFGSALISWASDAATFNEYSFSHVVPSPAALLLLAAGLPGLRRPRR